MAKARNSATLSGKSKKNMVSKVIISNYAMQQLDSYVLYVLLEKNNPQAAKSVTEDALATRNRLLDVADSLPLLEDKELSSLGYRKILFKSHDYFFIYRVDQNIAYVEATYHQLQDYENIFKTEVL